jgi:hypothetical protein
VEKGSPSGRLVCVGLAMDLERDAAGNRGCVACVNTESVWIHGPCGWIIGAYQTHEPWQRPRQHAYRAIKYQLSSVPTS